MTDIVVTAAVTAAMFIAVTLVISKALKWNK